MPETTIKTWTRYTLTAIDQAAINTRVTSVKLLPNIPAAERNAQQRMIATRLLVLTRDLAKKVGELRAERCFEPLQADNEFQRAWALIGSSGHANDAVLTIRLALEENIKLTHEANCHLRALGRAEMKTYK